MEFPHSSEDGMEQQQQPATDWNVTRESQEASSGNTSRNLQFDHRLISSIRLVIWEIAGIASWFAQQLRLTSQSKARPAIREIV